MQSCWVNRIIAARYQYTIPNILLSVRCIAFDRFTFFLFINGCEEINVAWRLLT
ncbi:hypothetical Protein YC6258_01280 [Gynuella sunshinyii YC6258]|uniref:Uncharacterized protein n=1 Tax=Gynuella sunshinyii YC6258 TaxID=1445510 RepID=A0A0C5VIY4_9GAMM|nr:hypothetical Protein YC6258_01280 [Gynuella sunshinyii YC6258]